MSGIRLPSRKIAAARKAKKAIDAAEERALFEIFEALLRDKTLRLRHN